MRAVKSVTIDSERRVIITFLDGSTETLYPNSIWCDLEALRQLIKDLLEEKADAIVQTINNVTVATFADGADEALIRKLLVNIEPIQEGTGDPSPENVRPIVGRTGLSVVRTGKNLLDPSLFIDQVSWHNITVKVEPDTVYTMSTDMPTDIGLITYFKNTNTAGGGNASLVYSGQPASIRSTSDGYIYVSQRRASGNDSFQNYNYQIEEGSTATDYEPYKGNTILVNWETEAGTVYGGSLDVVSGKLTVDSEYISPPVSIIGSNSTWASGRYSINLSNYGYPLDHGWEADPVGLYCDKLRPIRRKSVGDSTPYTIAYDTGTAKLQFFLTSDISTLEMARVWIANNPIQIVYRLKEPFEIQLTPQEITTLLGANNIWADSGDILELEYVADTKLYIGESQSGTLGSGRQSITKPEIQPISETVKDVTEAEEKETQEETEDERGE